MKKLSFIIATMLFALAVNAQTINIHQKNGEVIKYKSSEVDYIDFTPAAEEPEQDNDIVGKWICYYKKETEYKKSGSSWDIVYEKEEWYETKGSAHGFEFFADGTAHLLKFYIDGREEKESEDNFKYKVENDTLYILEDDPSDTDGYESWGTIKFTSEGFELMSDKDDGYYREVEFGIYHKKQ